MYLAKDKKDISEKIKLAVCEGKKENVKEKLRTQAGENTWMKRAEDIMIKL